MITSIVNQKGGTGKTTLNQQIKLIGVLTVNNRKRLSRSMIKALDPP